MLKLQIATSVWRYVYKSTMKVNKMQKTWVLTFTHRALGSSLNDDDDDDIFQRFDWSVGGAFTRWSGTWNRVLPYKSCWTETYLKIPTRSFFFSLRLTMLHSLLHVFIFIITDSWRSLTNYRKWPEWTGREIRLTFHFFFFSCSWTVKKAERRQIRGALVVSSALALLSLIETDVRFDLTCGKVPTHSTRLCF